MHHWFKIKIFEHKDLKINFAFYLSGNHFMFSNDQRRMWKPDTSYRGHPVKFGLWNYNHVQDAESKCKCLKKKDLISWIASTQSFLSSFRYILKQNWDGAQGCIPHCSREKMCLCVREEAGGALQRSVFMQIQNCGRTQNSQALPLHLRSTYCIDFSKSIHSSSLLAVQHINFKDRAQLDKSLSLSGILFLLHTMKLRMSY